MKHRALMTIPQKGLIKELNKIKPRAFTIMLDKGLIKQTNKRMKPRALTIRPAKVWQHNPIKRWMRLKKFTLHYFKILQISI